MKQQILTKAGLILLLIFSSISILHAEQNQNYIVNGARIEVIYDGEVPPVAIKPENSGYSKRLCLHAGTTGVVIGRKESVYLVNGEEIKDYSVLLVEWDEQRWQEWTNPGLAVLKIYRGDQTWKEAWMNAQTGKWIEWKGFVTSIHKSNVRVIE